MIKVHFSEPETAEWQAWCNCCSERQNALNESYAAGAPAQVDAELYRGQRDFYLGLAGPFYGKCAYCESLIAANHPGDLDHFRPKGRVTESSQPVMVKSNGDHEQPHPGYYWLSYDWRNLLPACEDCNRPSKRKTGGRRIGKWDEFPVKGLRAQNPGDEAKEEPLLLNPAAENVDPAAHLRIDHMGIFEGLTPEGLACIDLFGLNLRQGLISERQRAYQNAGSAVLGLLVAAGHKAKSMIDWNRKTYTEIKEGISPYSAAGRAGIEAMQETLRPHIESMGL